MKNHATVEFEREGFSSNVDERLAILRVNCDAFQSLKNSKMDRYLLDWFDLVAHDDDIHGILMLNSSGCYNDTVYKNFLSEVSGESIENIEKKGIAKFDNTNARALEINMLLNFIKKLIHFPKITISALRGEIVTPFIGLSLAVDLRFMEEGSSLNFSHIKYGIHPSGGLPFFLPLFLGQGKSMELLFTGGIISSEESAKLNLVNEVFPSVDFEDMCIRKAKKITGLNKQLIKTTKGLSNNFKTELDKFFEKESNYMLR